MICGFTAIMILLENPPTAFVTVFAIPAAAFKAVPKNMLINIVTPSPRAITATLPNISQPEKAKIGFSKDLSQMK